MIWSICCIGAFVGLCSGMILAKFFARHSIHHFGEISIKENTDVIFKRAQVQRKIILEEALLATKEQYQLEAFRLENAREIMTNLQKNSEKELNERQLEIDKINAHIEKKEQKYSQKKLLIEKTKTILKENEIHRSKIQHTYQAELEQKINKNKSEIFHSMLEEFINIEKLGISRYLIENAEILKTEAQKFARNVLDSVSLRYQPTFIWPKSSFTVQMNSKELLHKYFHEESEIIKLLIQETSSTISVLTINEEIPSLLKISGGSGVDKEVIRLSLEEMLAKNIFQTEKIKTVFEKNKHTVNKYMLKIAQDAVDKLKIGPAVHPEILKLIGALNYRTSHRQNQYFHSIEVAKLAGMIANEMNIDPLVVKRAGLLHDIGKALDYKIEGSHAVISGDYATRYGEQEEVVDTILAHHDDKIVETPFAYILKAADAMSGARPGARVDMEEGYHRRIDGISGVINSFQNQGVTSSAIMHAGREVHIFVDNNVVKQKDIVGLAEGIAKKLESEVEFPGQIRVTVIRRTEITEVA
jgi:ribonuclease Y